MKYWRNENKHWMKSEEQGPVSEADFAVNDLLKGELLAARPGYGWLSEESENDLSRLSREYVFIVDPIDGTRAFLAGEENWSHSLAIARHGVIEAGIVFLPALGQIFTAQRGDGAFLNGEPLQVSNRLILKGANVLAAKSNLENQYWIDGNVPEIKRDSRSSLAYRMALVGQGKYDAMLTLRQSWEWDVAAGSLIVGEANGVVTDQRGQSVLFNNADPRFTGMVAGSSVVHEKLIASLRPSITF